ncbi:MAG: hypothetical protein IPI35_16345 [Deltaproteobacteria bacterium]|nr:hypothetical protein [Deltaproteobacteria bacterium]
MNQTFQLSTLNCLSMLPAARLKMSKTAWLNSSTLATPVGVTAPISTSRWPTVNARSLCWAKAGTGKRSVCPLMSGKSGWLGFPGRDVLTMIAFALVDGNGRPLAPKWPNSRLTMGRSWALGLNQMRPCTDMSAAKVRLASSAQPRLPVTVTSTFMAPSCGATAACWGQMME